MNTPSENYQFRSPDYTAEELQRKFIMKVYGWMMGGLLLTAYMAYFTINSPAFLNFVFSSQLTYLGLVFAQLGLVVWLSTRISAMSALTAKAVFCAYSLLTGVTLSTVFLVYTAQSLEVTFLATALMFGATAFYGYITKQDLSGVGGFMQMALIGLIIASVVNYFFSSDMFNLIITYAGILIFVGLTAYDMQKIKQMSHHASGSGDAEDKGAIMGALSLYLDFINLFLLLLRLAGRKR